VPAWTASRLPTTTPWCWTEDNGAIDPPAAGTVRGHHRIPVEDAGAVDHQQNRRRQQDDECERTTQGEGVRPVIRCLRRLAGWAADPRM